MGRRIRYFPPHSLVEISDTIIQNRYMLRPCPEVNQRFAGVLGRAQRRYGMKICAVAVASSHYHMLLQPEDALQLSLFMAFFKSNLSKQIGTALHGWRGTIFAGRFHLVPVSNEEAAQVQRLRYLLAHGVKEGLVDRVVDWPGIESATSLMTGQPLIGAWHSTMSNEQPGVREEVHFSPLPCWQHDSKSTWHRTVKAIVAEIDAAAVAERSASGTSSKGQAAVLDVPPLYQPPEPEQTPMPSFHALGHQARKAMIEVWSQVLRLYREASAALRQGSSRVPFPEGTFPPALPFVHFHDPTLAIDHV